MVSSQSFEQLAYAKLNPMFGAVDIGGTKTILAVFSDSGEIKKNKQFPTSEKYEDFLRDLETHVVDLSTKNYQVTTVAVPGRLDRVHGIGISFGRLSWSKVPIRDDLERIFSSPILIENDAKLAGFSESREFPDFHKILYLTISTGIGGGFIVDGRIDHSLEDSEVGFMLFEHGGKLTYWQDFASGKAILEQFGKPAKEISKYEDWDKIAKNLSLGIIDLIASLTPDLIIIGGSIGAYFDKFEDQLNKHLNDYRNDMITIPPIKKAKRVKEAVIYGCYEFGKDYATRSN